MKNQILDDFKKACKPKKITVIGDFHPRGGIKTVVKANWPEIGQETFETGQ